VIVVTVGTNEAPFDRLLHAVGELPGDEEILVQHGSSALKPAVAKCVDFLPFDELVALVSQARVVVTHAGVGSIMVALSQGKRPIVVPRLTRFGEAVDDHQLPFARRLAERGLVTLLEDELELASAIGRVHDVVTLDSSARSGLAGELAGYLRLLVDGGDMGHRPGRRHSR
jgi:UDP-N-acetylglucosamine transferase subunit ALG13